MLQFVRNPHYILLVSIPFVWIIGFLSNEPVSINIYDTYFILSTENAVFMVSMYYALLALVYWTLLRLHKQLNSLLTLIHLAGTIDLLFILWLCSLWIDIDQFWILTSFSILFLAAQITFVFNVLGAIFINSENINSNELREK